ncbi:hypothetical protein BAY59_36555 [Prauserella coralliicola]|nr:hypothetical protein BAY59_36555 [Prauserella coralliicola]
MGMLKTAYKAFDKSAEWVANRDTGKVIKSTGTPGGRCVGCGRGTRNETDGIPHCTRPACVRKAGEYL